MNIKTVLPVERTVRVLVEGSNGLSDLDEILTDSGNANPAGTSFEGTNAEELDLDQSTGAEDDATISAPDSVSGEPAKAFVQLPWWQQNNLP
jgi:hypothetical protein